MATGAAIGALDEAVIVAPAVAATGALAPSTATAPAAVRMAAAVAAAGAANAFAAGLAAAGFGTSSVDSGGFSVAAVGCCQRTGSGSDAARSYPSAHVSTREAVPLSALGRGPDRELLTLLLKLLQLLLLFAGSEGGGKEEASALPLAMPITPWSI